MCSLSIWNHSIINSVELFATNEVTNNSDEHRFSTATCWVNLSYRNIPHDKSLCPDNSWIPLKFNSQSSEEEKKSSQLWVFGKYFKWDFWKENYSGTDTFHQLTLFICCFPVVVCGKNFIFSKQKKEKILTTTTTWTSWMEHRKDEYDDDDAVQVGICYPCWWWQREIVDDSTWSVVEWVTGRQAAISFQEKNSFSLVRRNRNSFSKFDYSFSSPLQFCSVFTNPGNLFRRMQLLFSTSLKESFTILKYGIMQDLVVSAQITSVS